MTTPTNTHMNIYKIEVAGQDSVYEGKGLNLPQMDLKSWVWLLDQKATPMQLVTHLSRKSCVHPGRDLKLSFLYIHKFKI